ncbi:TetR/AcrR family transcriptional regulator [Solihabitans fulvus]|uniref:TetR/AcrR family transcriptional regulator n=1 Tax=Solihabitans fulvus TaxID=1892852 RepID=A0A5B2WJZ0_9PSEU|nr:TetR/AcrR family transcriptional regulator [Solihabitans fulvus]KAA2252393.1 TetR/AcrR family transcriptional regulator [Solihabitans fulvus]
MNTTSSRGAGTRPEGAPRRRADAERNIAAILDAAAGCLGRQPQVSMADVARAAGVGRVTLYAHFPSREVLLEAVLDRTIAQAGAVIEQSQPDEGPADDALRRLLRSSWQVLDRHLRLFDVAQRELGPARLREHHDPAISRIEHLLARGQKEKTFRTDLPLNWLVTCVYTLLHAAADDVNNGRLAQKKAGHVLEATILSALAVPPNGSQRRAG